MRLGIAGLKAIDYKLQSNDFGSSARNRSLVTSIVVDAPVFDACLQDEKRGNELRFNSKSGDYVFCSGGGFKLSGTGSLSKNTNSVTLREGPSELDRRLVVEFDAALKKGTAVVRFLLDGTKLTIRDKNTTDNSCSCSP